MTLANDIFRRAGLVPKGKEMGTGHCGCDPRTMVTLFKANTGRPRCGVCLSLNQAYPNGENMTRLTDGSFLLITPDEIIFWGKASLDKINPKIQIRSATGEMTSVIIGLIRDPPKTPWLCYTFAKSNSSASIRVTEDNRILRFGGKLQMRKQLVPEVNREQVMALLSIGLSSKEWDHYITEYAAGHSRKTMVKLEQKYPDLASLRIIPRLNSPEYFALSMLARPQKGVTHDAMRNSDGE